METALTNAQSIFKSSLLKAWEANHSITANVQIELTAILWPYLTKITNKDTKVDMKALDERGNIAGLSASYWLGSVLLPYGLSIPSEYAEQLKAAQLDPKTLLQLCLTIAVNTPQTFVLTVQPPDDDSD